MTATIVELRCPVGPRRLLAKMRSEGGTVHVTEGNLMEFACRDCAHAARQSGSTVRRVLHRFDFAGALVETIYE